MLGLVRLGVRPINTRMKITELLAPIKSEDTTSSATTSSAIQGVQTQDIVPQDIVSENIQALEVDSEIEEHDDHSAIAEGVSQIFRRQKGGKPTKAKESLRSRMDLLALSGVGMPLLSSLAKMKESIPFRIHD